MERSDIIQRMKSKTTTIDQFNFDTLTAPPLLSLLTYEDIEYFRYLASSIKYSAKTEYKLSEIDRVMKMRGFKKLGGGTNRVVYKHLEIDTIVVKIAVDKVAMNDSPREYQNQFYLKPYVTKVFEVSPCGTVGLFERCDQITSREEFKSIATEVFDLLSNWIIGKYIMEDIGSEYFLNYCVRPGFGPVLCDFPYLYELDGAKLYCQKEEYNGFLCDGLIDYDEGFNHLYCTKCGAKYKAIELKKAIDNKLIIKKEEKENTSMRIVAQIGDKILKDTDSTKQSKKFESRRERTYRKLKQTNLTDGILVTTSLQQKDEETITKMNELPNWDDVAPAEEVKEEVVELEHVPAEDIVVETTIKSVEEVEERINRLSDEHSDDIDAICLETIEYIKDNLSKDYKDINIGLSIVISDDSVDGGEILYENEYHPVNTTDKEETEVAEEDSDNEESEAEREPEDAYESETEVKEEEPKEVFRQLDGFIPETVEIPVGATQVNDKEK